MISLSHNVQRSAMSGAALKIFLLFFLSHSQKIFTQIPEKNESDFHFNNISKSSKLEIRCRPTMNINLDELITKIDGNVSEIAFIDCCMSEMSSLADLIDVVEAETTENRTISRIYLENVEDLASTHLKGMDERNIDVKIESALHTSLPSDLFSTVPMLKTLEISVELAETLPDFSTLNMLKSLIVKIGLNGNGKQLSK